MDSPFSPVQVVLFSGSLSDKVVVEDGRPERNGKSYLFLW